MKLSVSALSVYSLIFAASSVWADVAVIVNPSVSTAPSQSDVANVFLGKDKTLKGVDQKDWNPIKEKFYSAVTSKNESQLKSYWSGLVFTGKGQPLTSVSDDAAVIAKVSVEPGAIGYVDSTSVTDKVKVLFTLP